MTMLFTPNDLRWLFELDSDSNSTAPQKYRVREIILKIDHTLRVLASSPKLDEFKYELFLLSQTFAEILEKLTFEEVEFIRLGDLPDKESANP